MDSTAGRERHRSQQRGVGEGKERALGLSLRTQLLVRLHTVADVAVRIARRSDLEVLESELPGPTPTRHRQWLSQQDEGSVAYLVAWLEERPVGHGLIHWAGARDAEVRALLGHCPEIYSLAVVEELQSRGIGTRLVRALEELAARRGFARAGLAVALANPAARSLYERLGYRKADIGTFIDRWSWIDSAGKTHREQDECQFLVRPLESARLEEQ